MTAPRRPVPALLLVALVVATAACGGSGPDPLTLDMRRVALDLAFEADKDAPKPPPNVVVQELPPPESFAITLRPSDRFVEDADFEEEDEPPAPTRTPARVVKQNPCPPADADATPSELATPVIPSLPAAGRYTFRRSGNFAIEGGLFPFRGKLSPRATRDYDKVERVQPPPGPTGAPTAAFNQFDIVDPGLNGAFTVRTFQVKPTEIVLVQRLDHTESGDVIFRPTPPVRFMGLTIGEGDSWNSAGIDPSNGTSVVIQGKIVRKESVDVCGKVFDAYRVESTERFVSPSRSFQSNTTDTENNAATGPTDGKPNVYWVATQRGGLIIQEENHTRTRLTVGGVPITVLVDSLMTVNDVTPGPTTAGE